MSVPNQRTITINKSTADRYHPYTTNSLSAIDEAAGRLCKLVSFKLYIYLSKNQSNYTFNLSSSSFCVWANCGMPAYRSAFSELVDKGYLIKKDGTETVFTFYDKSQLDCNKNSVTVEIPSSKVEEQQAIEERLNFFEY